MCGFRIGRKISVFVEKISVFVKWIEVDIHEVYSIMCGFVTFNIVNA